MHHFNNDSKYQNNFFFPKSSYLRSFMRFKSRLVEKWRWWRRRSAAVVVVAETQRAGDTQADYTVFSALHKRLMWWGGGGFSFFFQSDGRPAVLRSHSWVRLRGQGKCHGKKWKARGRTGPEFGEEASENSSSLQSCCSCSGVKQLWHSAHPSVKAEKQQEERGKQSPGAPCWSAACSSLSAGRSRSLVRVFSVLRALVPVVYMLVGLVTSQRAPIVFFVPFGLSPGLVWRNRISLCESQSRSLIATKLCNLSGI